MTKTSNTNDSTWTTNLLISFDWGISSNTSTKKWWHFSDVHSSWNMEDPILINLHMRSISSEVFSIKKNSFITKVGISLLTVFFTVIAWISDGTDTNSISNFNKWNLWTNFGDLSDNLMSWTAGISALSPMLSNCCQIRMTNWCVQNFESHLIFFDFLESERIHDQIWVFVFGDPSNTISVF